MDPPRKTIVVHFNRLKPYRQRTIIQEDAQFHGETSEEATTYRDTEISHDQDLDELIIANQHTEGPIEEPTHSPQANNGETENTEAQPLRRSTRTRQPPTRYGELLPSDIVVP